MASPRLPQSLAARIGIVAAVLLVLGAITFALTRPEPEPAAAPVTTLPPSTTTTQAPDPHLTTVATATVPKLEVFTDKPVDPATPTTSPGGLAEPASFRTSSAAAVASAPPIPRKGLVSAGAAKTDTGYTFDNPTYNKKPLVLVVTAEDGDWIKVLLPARPNGTEGWVRATDVTLTEHNFHGTLDISDRHLTVWEGNTVIADTLVVVGKDNTPTPIGLHYIIEVLTAAEAGVYAGGAYGPNILPTNAYSDALDLFDGGLPVIAFHGTNQPDLIGTASSNGCVRMPNEVVTLLAEKLPAGTPIDVVE